MPRDARVFAVDFDFALIILLYDGAALCFGAVLCDGGAWLSAGPAGFDSSVEGPIGMTGEGAGAGFGARVKVFVAGRTGKTPSLRLDSFEAIPPALMATTVALNVEPGSPVLAVKTDDVVD